MNLSEICSSISDILMKDIIMGTEYGLYKIDRGEYFQLGKGEFYEIFSYEYPFVLESMFSVTELYNSFLKLFDGIFKWSFDSEKDKLIYANWLANKLFEWSSYDRLLFLNDYQEIEWKNEDDSCGCITIISKFNPIYYNFKYYKETGNRYKEML
jgi:hypothetical protein